MFWLWLLWLLPQQVRWRLPRNSCFYYYFMENCHTWIIIIMWQNDLHTNTSRSVWPILYGLMIKMLQYKMYPAGELRCPTTALVSYSSCIFSFSSYQINWLSLFQYFPSVFIGGTFVPLQFHFRGHMKIFGDMSENGDFSPIVNVNYLINVS